MLKLLENVCKPMCSNHEQENMRWRANGVHGYTETGYYWCCRSWFHSFLKGNYFNFLNFCLNVFLHRPPTHVSGQYQSYIIHTVIYSSKWLLTHSQKVYKAWAVLHPWGPLTTLELNKINHPKVNWTSHMAKLMWAPKTLC